VPSSGRRETSDKAGSTPAGRNSDDPGETLFGASLAAVCGT
jgi:hypothetical protein